MHASKKPRFTNGLTAQPNSYAPKTQSFLGAIYMDLKDIKNETRLLLNAEPFGFGPTAAIASFFPLLRPHFENIGYIGKNILSICKKHCRITPYMM